VVGRVAGASAGSALGGSQSSGWFRSGRQASVARALSPPTRRPAPPASTASLAGCGDTRHVGQRAAPTTGAAMAPRSQRAVEEAREVGVAAAAGKQAAFRCHSCHPGGTAAEKRVIHEGCPAGHLGFGRHVLEQAGDRIARPAWGVAPQFVEPDEIHLAGSAVGTALTVFHLIQYCRDHESAQLGQQLGRLAADLRQGDWLAFLVQGLASG